MSQPRQDASADAPRFQLTVTDRTDEWSADNDGLLMPTQSILCDTPEAVLELNGGADERAGE